MSDVAIKFENISKQYRLGTIGTGTISHDLKRWWIVNIRGKEDPYLKIGSENDRSVKADSDYVWALRDINLEVKEGEVLGIIGKNGAGKSTLLKILSRVTSPTTGQIIAKGRIASLLEVGTGFHPEMTGRENVFMNGSIMGMSKMEINKKFDEIVNFSGVEKYIDTPVKRYSTGMTVRLGFAIAAHLEPDILVVDEVLAVGDAEFQSKAIGKMQNVSQAKGRTVLFVSHNMNAVKSLCNRSFILKNGIIQSFGATNRIIEEYLNSESGLVSNIDCSKERIGDENCKLISARIIDNKNNVIDYQDINEDLNFEFTFQILNKTKGVPNMHLFTIDGIHIFFSSGPQREYNFGTYLAKFKIAKGLLNIGKYSIGIAFTSLAPFNINFYLKEALSFEILENTNLRELDYVGTIPGIIRPKINWEVNNI